MWCRSESLVHIFVSSNIRFIWLENFGSKILIEQLKLRKDIATLISLIWVGINMYRSEFKLFVWLRFINSFTLFTFPANKNAAPFFIVNWYALILLLGNFKATRVSTWMLLQCHNRFIFNSYICDLLRIYYRKSDKILVDNNCSICGSKPKKIICSIFGLHS